jgi:hypothetical protein
MSYIFYHDSTLTKMVIEKIKDGQRAAVYALADAVIVLNDKYTKGIDLAYEASQKTGSGFPVIWSVDISFTGKELMKDKHLLFYANSPTPILDKLLKLEPKKHVDTPKSVLIKMARKRLNAIRQEVKNQNEWVAERAHRKYYNIVIIGDLDSVEVVDKVCEDFRNSRVNQKFNPDCAREWDSLKKKALFDDDIVKEAWKYLLVNEIHNS